MAHKIDGQLWEITDKMAAIDRAEFERRASEIKPAPAQPTVMDKRSYIDKQLTNLMDGLVSGDITKEYFRKKKAELGAELAELVKEKSPGVPIRINVTEVVNIICTAREWKKLAQFNPASLNLILRDLFKRVIIHPDNRLEFVPWEYAEALLRGLI